VSALIAIWKPGQDPTLEGPAELHWADHFGDLGKVLLGPVAIPYAANKASASVSDIIGAIRKRD
jgi:hypothetical protein